MSSSTNIDNKGKDILILRKGPTQGLREHSLSVEKMYSINFTKVNTKYCLSLHYKGTNKRHKGFFGQKTCTSSCAYALVWTSSHNVQKIIKDFNLSFKTSGDKGHNLSR